MPGGREVVLGTQQKAARDSRVTTKKKCVPSYSSLGEPTELLEAWPSIGPDQRDSLSVGGDRRGKESNTPGQEEGELYKSTLERRM